MLKVDSSHMVVDRERARDLDDVMARMLERDDEYRYSVAWIDCLARGRNMGRSVLIRGDHAPDDGSSNGHLGGVRLKAPPLVPAGLLNRTTIRAFNEAYYRAAPRHETGRVEGLREFFYPLDAVGDWNRIYGRRGFVQYQCVVPTAHARSVLGEILERISRRGTASFLAVLKQLGRGHGMLSFPLEGFTLTLDVPVTEAVFPLLDEFDSLVVAAGGRLYLAKDARQARATFAAGYPELARFRDLRRAIGAEGRISSFQSARLGI
jgi:hypothetical protein